jgi:DNA-binding NarL/FixJ family response regulator
MDEAPVQSVENSLPVQFAAPLTRAERAVVALLMTGCANREIAAARGSTESTVKHQLVSVYRKLGVASRTRLIALILSRRVT